MDYKEMLSKIADIVGIKSTELSADLYAKLDNGDIISAVAWRVGQPIFSVSQSGKSPMADGEYMAIIPTNDNGESVYKLVVSGGSISQIDLQNNVKMSEEIVETTEEVVEMAVDPNAPAPEAPQPTAPEEKMAALEQMVSELLQRVAALEAEDAAEGPEDMMPESDSMDMEKEMAMSAQKKFTGAPVDNPKVDMGIKTQGGDTTMNNVWKRMNNFK